MGGGQPNKTTVMAQMIIRELTTATFLFIAVPSFTLYSLYNFRPGCKKNIQIPLTSILSAGEKGSCEKIELVDQRKDGWIGEALECNV
jgi:hypothetical protein